jgi:hypothetical protein
VTRGENFDPERGIRLPAEDEGAEQGPDQRVEETQERCGRSRLSARLMPTAPGPWERSDATLVTAHSEKERAAGNSKGGFASIR